MKKDFLTDYLGFIALKILGPVLRALPSGVTSFIGRRLGDAMYYFGCKYRAVAYANLKRVFASELSSCQLSRLCRESFRTFGQNLLDIFLIPLISQEHIHKYFTVEGQDYIDAAFKKGKGIIFVATHEGSWELSSVAFSNLGFPFQLLIRNQGFPRLNGLLNDYRRQKGCRIIETRNETRELIKTLKNNQSLGMTVDQGGKDGTLVDFFGKRASLASGAVRLAIKYDAALLQGFYARVKDSYYRIIVRPAPELEKTGDIENDVKNNLAKLIKSFEPLIKQRPQEYLWSYKIWKYSDQRDILILSDGKAGHLRQSEAVAAALGDLLKSRGMTARVKIINVDFKNKFLRHFIKKQSYRELKKTPADIIISCGSALAPVNYALSRENQARSAIIMRPPFGKMNKFDLVIMPKHDQPPPSKNVVVTDGALNLIDEKYLCEQSGLLLSGYSQLQTPNLKVGLLVGGNTKDFSLDRFALESILNQLKTFARANNALILATTSRRTPPEVEGVLRQGLENDPSCGLLVIASVSNPPYTMGGILGLSKIVVVSAESISMISEAASSGKYVVVFDARVNRKHRRFLDNLAREKYIYLVKPENILSALDKIVKEKPAIKILNDCQAIKEKLGLLI